MTRLTRELLIFIMVIATLIFMGAVIKAHAEENYVGLGSYHDYDDASGVSSLTTSGRPYQAIVQPEGGGIRFCLTGDAGANAIVDFDATAQILADGDSLILWTPNMVVDFRWDKDSAESGVTLHYEVIGKR